MALPIDLLAQNNYQDGFVYDDGDIYAEYESNSSLGDNINENIINLESSVNKILRINIALLSIRHCIKQFLTPCLLIRQNHHHLKSVVLFTQKKTLFEQSWMMLDISL